MSYLFNTDSDRDAMLDRIGVASIDDLFSVIPPELRREEPLHVPPALSEPELQRHVSQLAAKNAGAAKRVCFLGGGAYDHFIPSVVDELASRGEFYTAYTPYQAEASQGSLQCFFEFQTLICQLTGLDVANASLYEGATSVSEAAFMAMRVTRRHQRIVVLGTIHPEYRQVLKTYLTHLDCDVVQVPIEQGVVPVDRVAEVMDDRTACLIVQQPNFLGYLEDVEALGQVAHQYGALFVVSCDPISLGLLKRPGQYGADIAVAEGQSLGIPLQYGGPYLGILACRSEYMRKMPGRLIGQTQDRDGKTCYVLNLQAREQHIRRDKATSNICTNQGLMAIRATVYLSLLGPQGLREVAELSCRKAHYAAARLREVAGLDLMFERPFFREFAVRCADPEDIVTTAREAGYDVGPVLKPFALPGLGADVPHGLLWAFTEQRTRAEIDGLIDALTGD